MRGADERAALGLQEYVNGAPESKSNKVRLNFEVDQVGETD